MSLTTSAHWMYNPGGNLYDYEIDGSLRFATLTASHNASRTFGTPTNAKKNTISFWYKRGKINVNSRIFTDTGTGVYIGSTNQIGMTRAGVGNWLTVNLLRDVSSWYHVVLRVDTTLATASDRIKIYINGVLQSASGGTLFSQNEDTYYATSGTKYIGGYSPYFVNGYLAEFNFIDGTALDASNFGETKSGVWIPKEYSGSYGNNGFYLKFDGNVNDSSGNGNNFTSFNINGYDYGPDSPTNNFAILNDNDNRSGITIYEAGLYASTGPTWRTAGSTFAFNKTTGGKWYWEYRAFQDCYTGMNYEEYGTNAGNNLSQGVGWRATNGILYVLGSSIATYSSYTTGDIISYAYDADTGELWIAKNGTWQNSGNPAAGTGEVATLNTDFTWSPAVSGYNSGAYLNFGQDGTFTGNETAQGNSDENGFGDFYYSVPSGFLALCTANLPDPTFDPAADDPPEDYFNTVLYTGNSGTNSITGVGFQPDFVWIKSRNNTYNNELYDVIRGQQRVYSDLTNAEDTGSLTSFDSDGFTHTSGTIGGNASGTTYAAWNWKAGGTGVSNTDGSITSTVSANQDAGFSVVTWTGNGSVSTIGHGLSQTPDFIITKNRDFSDNWGVGVGDLGWTGFLYLNGTQAFTTTSTQWNNTAPTSSVFTVGTDSRVNRSGDEIIAYCFASKDGYSKFGSYKGDGTNDGRYVHIGFRPAFIMIKRTDTTGVWLIVDSVRDPFNSKVNGGMPKVLLPNLNNAEDTGADVCDAYSNGFKFFQGATSFNASNGSYIYMAFAEQPFKYANAR